MMPSNRKRGALVLPCLQHQAAAHKSNDNKAQHASMTEQGCTLQECSHCKVSAARVGCVMHVCRCLEVDRHLTQAATTWGIKVHAWRQTGTRPGHCACLQPGSHLPSQGSRAGTAACCGAAHLWRMGGSTTGCMQALLPQSSLCVRSSTCIPQCSMQCMQQAWLGWPCLLQALHGHAGTL